VVKKETNLALVLFRSETLTSELMLIVGGIGITAICAQITIPQLPVPITLQTFAVLLCGILLGPRLGALSLVLYLVVGACGAPVFAAAAFGPHTLFGPTGGYLLSFPLAAFLLGWLSAKGWDRGVWSLFLAMVLAQGVILICGASWLSFYVGGLANAWRVGVQPFLLVEAVKSGVLILWIPAAWKVVNRD
jgi:biotin transport system substrate-specific component